MAEDRGSGGGPSVALIAVIAVLVIAGLAIWFTQQGPSTHESSTTTTEYRENVVPSGGETNQGSGTQQQTQPNTDAPPDTGQ